MCLNFEDCSAERITVRCKPARCVRSPGNIHFRQLVFWMLLKQVRQHIYPDRCVLLGGARNGMAFLIIAFIQSLITTAVDSQSGELPKSDEAPG
jgi:hypothetical protein